MTGYILHIGTPKTGSTSIQAAITHNLTVLEQANILYPKTGRFRAAHNNLAQSFNRPHSGHATALATEIAEARDQAPDTRILLSSEMFSLAAPEKLRDTLPDAMERPVKIVVYLRRQDQYVESFYKQKAKNGRMRLSFDAFIASRQCRRITDYIGLLDNWQNCFPHAQLVPRPFERARFPDGDIVADFASLIEVNAAEMDEVATEHNISPSRDVVEMLLAAQPNLGQAGTAELFHSLKALDLPGFSASSDMFDPEDRRQFLAQFDQMNETLRAQYFPDDQTLFAPPKPEVSPHRFTASQKALLEGLIASLSSPGGGAPEQED